MAELHGLISAAQSVNGSVGVVAFDGYTITFSMITSTTPVTYKLTARKGTDVRTITWRDGAKGNTGNGIANAVLNADYTLTLTFTDGTTYTTPSIRGAKGDNGSDASVTAENIATALGYTPADADDVTELSEDIAQKLTEPSSGLAVGKYFRIASIDASGHAVLEAVDAPATDVRINGTSITQDGVANIPYGATNSYGVVKGSATNGIYVTDGVIGTTVKNVRDFTSANNWMAVTKGTLNNVLATPSIMPELTSTEQAAARNRMGAFGGKFELIEEIVVADESLTTLERTAEPDGTPYNFSQFAIYIKMTGTNTKATNLMLYSGNTLSCNFYFGQKNNATVQMAKAMWFDIFGLKRATTNTWSIVGGSSSFNTVNGLDGTRDFIIDCPNMTRLTSAPIDFPVGTVVRLYGVRA